MISDSFGAFGEIREKYNLVKRERTTLFGATIDTWTFPDALNAKGVVVEYKLGLRFAGQCFYDTVDDCIKFIGLVPVEPSNYDYKIKSLREMFIKAQIQMKHYRMEKRIEKIEKDFV